MDSGHWTSDDDFDLAYDEASTSSNPHPSMISNFVKMGFPKGMVEKAIEENGESSTERILDALLTLSDRNRSPSESEPVPCNMHVSDDLADVHSCRENKEDAEHLLEKDKKLLCLIEMGYPVDEASSAIDVSGHDTSISELMDFISAAQMAKTTDAPRQGAAQPISDEGVEIGPDYEDSPTVKKRKKFSEAEERWKQIESWPQREKVSGKKQKSISAHEDGGTMHIPKHMIGSGIPNDPRHMHHREIHEAAVGPPFFFLENTVCWSTLPHFLYKLEAEVVDPSHFSPVSSKRKYIHNLPIHNRYNILPIPPLTTQEALPLTKRWWPSWDTRTKLNCMNSCTASGKVTQGISEALERCGGVPLGKTQQYVLDECANWNLVWTGKNKVAPLEPDEIEVLLGYPKDHTRGGGTSRTNRYKALGNSCQVDTVAYYFSGLKGIFPNGINVLSIFSGIGGAEVALHRLGITLNNVVSVELSEVNRNIYRSWWEQTCQKGDLIEVEDLQQLTRDKLQHLIQSIGGFDLVVGGSMCLTGSNRVSRDGFQGEHSDDYFRILNDINYLLGSNR